MSFLEYLKLSNNYKPLDSATDNFEIGLVTNFTDDVLVKLLNGVLIKNSIKPKIYKTPYKQYGFALKNSSHEIWQTRRLVFFLFDQNFYMNSEFSGSNSYTGELLSDLENYVSKVSSTVVVNTFLLPYNGPRGNHVINHELFARAQDFNLKLWELAKKYSNLEVFDLNRLVYLHGEKSARDLRGMYAFDTPFTNEFLTSLAEEWLVYVLALSGKAKKVIVLDLDNTLWGGVVGELGPLQIAVGPNYPGAAFQNFQRALLEYQKAGVLLAINSKNNMADVEEVFEKNPHMILQKNHFAAITANWEDKATNLINLAKQLNLGLDSFVFLDDDPLQREFVRSRLPEVLVPELGLEPESYINILYSLAVFSPFRATAEDLKKNQQYKEEQKRQDLQKKSTNLEDFIADLGIKLDISLNAEEHIPRISQLTLKTNQFNITTKRYSMPQIQEFMTNGLIFSCNITDKFGDYGITALAIIKPKESAEKVFYLDTLLMSCRVLGRGVEFSFMDFIVRKIYKDYDAKILEAEFISTMKNEPAKNFLADFGFKQIQALEGLKEFSLNVSEYCTLKNPKVNQSITVNYI